MNATNDNRGIFWRVVAGVGVAAIFIFIAMVAYLPEKPSAIDHGSLSPEERKTKLLELRANEKKFTTSYAWIDETKGVVQLPIEEAMRLTVQDAQRVRK